MRELFVGFYVHLHWHVVNVCSNTKCGILLAKPLENGARPHVIQLGLGGSHESQEFPTAPTKPGGCMERDS